MVEANGIAMHVAECGGEVSPRAVVVFLHGFPELWYSWGYQMQHLAAQGYRCVAPDLCGIVRPEVGIAVPEAPLVVMESVLGVKGWCSERKETRSARVRTQEWGAARWWRAPEGGGKKGLPKVEAKTNMWGSHVSEWRKREAAGVLWSIRKMLMHTVV